MKARVKTFPSSPGNEDEAVLLLQSSFLFLRKEKSVYCCRSLVVQGSISDFFCPLRTIVKEKKRRELLERKERQRKEAVESKKDKER